MKPFEDARIMGGAMVLLGAIIIAGSLVWYGTRIAPQALDPSAAPPPPSQERPSDVPDPETTYEKKLSDFGGMVESVSADRITLTQGPASAVLISGQTAIYRQGAKKSDAAYKAEMDVFLKSISYGDPEDQYYAPNPYNLVRISLQDIKVGDMVNIKAKSQPEGGAVEAVFIEVLPTPAL